ncbi:MAG: hypothetical protein Q8873_05905 [Bacillota bacterium]|nr:hypothetical protein [Bacillota bacterium]
MDNKRITIFAGHYGSGKTNIAVNYALMLREAYPDAPVSVADLDIVNPYFRTKDSLKVMESNGINLISSPFANSNVDLPSLPAETYSILDNHEILAVIDVGGDDRGALALGRYIPAILKEDNYEMLFVINKYRPLTKTSQGALEIMAEIECAAKIRFTGIVNNSNLGDATTAKDVLSSLSYAEEISKKTGLEIRMTTINTSLFGELEGKIDNLVPLKLYVKQSWTKQEV